MVRVILIGLILFTACKRHDGLYCDETTPCTDPARPYCDVHGEYPAADGVGRTCIADPNEAGQPDAAIMLPDATVVCSESFDCSPELPICRSNLCELCENDPECLQRDPDVPRCSGAGACLQCLSNVDCAVPNRPFCDSSGVCAPCSAHSECDSGVCEIESGQCVASANIIYADSVNGTNSPACGDAPGTEACQTLTGALSRVPFVGRDIILMAPGFYTENVNIGVVDLLIIGYGAHLRRPASLLGSSLSVSGTAEISIQGLSVEGGQGGNGGHGIACLTATLNLVDVTMTQNQDVGLYGDLCAVDMIRTKVHTNAQQGVWLQNISKLAMRESVIRDNGFHGLSAHNSEVRIYRSRIMENETGGVFLEGGSFELENNFIVRNGNLLQSPAGEVTGGIVVRPGLGVSAGPHTLLHNTIADNLAPMAAASAGVMCGLAPGVMRSDSNIVVGNERNGTDPQSVGLCGFRFSNVTGIDGNNGNISLAPTFVNAGMGDYHLASGSAGLNVADPNSPTGEDIDGDARPNGGGFDMGADER